MNKINKVFCQSFLTIIGITYLSFISNGDFRKQQLTYQRVKNAYKEKWDVVKADLLGAGIDTGSFHIFIRAFKQEGKLELWAASDKNSTFKRIKEYAICAKSGNLGPKRMQGDGQVPEGFYQVSVFNPWSNYHLSLGINYPNQSDRILGKKGSLGGDIMIHGNCVTIGCIPITDDKIREIYVLAVEARSNGQTQIPVHIFPSRLSQENVEFLISKYKDQTELIAFWQNLKIGYNYFELKKMIPKTSILPSGAYSFH